MEDDATLRQRYKDLIRSQLRGVLILRGKREGLEAQLRESGVTDAELDAIRLETKAELDALRQAAKDDLERERRVGLAAEPTSNSMEVSKVQPGPSDKVAAKKHFNVLYAALLIVAIGLTVYAMWRAEKAEVKLEIKFDVGTVIAGLLAGGGVAAAGLSYAASKLDTSPPEPSDKTSNETEAA